ncbi:unnamed protein product [Blepharisma stoltei]|uniref:Uncharacterized protein n=1 Tax=Blepharisma stoltei TaxID=1481888 RepID=A0AAU9ISQ3_9CILI|nr:unnamed protein product [Blepharisma stoltei]
MEDELYGIISCILKELSMKSENNAPKQKIREFIQETAAEILRSSSFETIKEVFRVVADMAGGEENNDKELLGIFSQLAAIIMKNELSSRIFEFERFRKKALRLDLT